MTFNIIAIPHLFISLSKKCPYSELFWSAFFSDFPAFGLNTEYLSGFSPNAGKHGKKADQNNSEYGLFLRSVCLSIYSLNHLFIHSSILCCLLTRASSLCCIHLHSPTALKSSGQWALANPIWFYTLTSTFLPIYQLFLPFINRFQSFLLVYHSFLLDSIRLPVISTHLPFVYHSFLLLYVSFYILVITINNEDSFL